MITRWFLPRKALENTLRSDQPVTVVSIRPGSSPGSKRIIVFAATIQFWFSLILFRAPHSWDPNIWYAYTVFGPSMRWLLLSCSVLALFALIVFRRHRLVALALLLPHQWVLMMASLDAFTFVIRDPFSPEAMPHIPVFVMGICHTFAVADCWKIGFQLQP